MKYYVKGTTAVSSARVISGSSQHPLKEEMEMRNGRISCSSYAMGGSETRIYNILMVVYHFYTAAGVEKEQTGRIIRQDTALKTNGV